MSIDLRGPSGGDELIVEPGLLARFMALDDYSDAQANGAGYARWHDDVHLPFVGPAGGKVIVRMSARLATGGNSVGQWRLQDAAGVEVPLSDTLVRFANGVLYWCDSWLLLDAAAGTPFDWWWATACGYGGSVTTSTSQPSILGGGPSAGGGPTFEVYDADEFALAHGRRTASGDFTGDSGIDLAFEVPDSGCVDLYASAVMGDGAGGYIDFRSGGVALRGDSYVYQHQATGRSRGGGRTRIGGLTPGAAMTLEPYTGGTNCRPGNFGTSQLCAFVREVRAPA